MAGKATHPTKPVPPRRAGRIRRNRCGDRERQRLYNMMKFADSLISTAKVTGLETEIARAAPGCWHTALVMIESRSLQVRLLGYNLALEALLRTPAAVDALVAALCADLAAMAPAPGVWSSRLLA